MNLPTNPSADAQPNVGVRIFRIAVAILVAAAIAYTIWKAVGELQRQQFDLTQVRWGWIAVAVVSYCVSILLSAAFWHRVLLAMSQRPALPRSIGAFCASQLGKYIPGKAMVVVMRTDLIRGPDVSIGPAATSVFIETLTWLFTGSAIASLLLLVLFNQPLLQIVAGVMMIVAGILTAPPTLRAIATRMGKVKGKKTGKVLLGLTFKTMLPGWVLLSIGWCFNGLSLWLVLRALPGIDLQYSDYWLALTCVTLSTAAGFVSLLPGGLGVRELVMIPLLATRFDGAIVVVAAIIIRIVWLFAELCLAGLSYTGPFARREG